MIVFRPKLKSSDARGSPIVSTGESSACKREDVMKFRTTLILSSAVLSAVFLAGAQDVYTPDRDEVLRLIRADKLDLILPGAMRDHHVDMWIHVTRAGDPDPLAYEFGRTSGYLIFTDLGDRIERAQFSGVFETGDVPNIDIHGSVALARAISGYDYGKVDAAVYDEITEFVAERDPQTIAVNFSDWLAVADGISHTQYLKLEKILGPKYSERIVSAENVITAFRSRRTLREVTVQTNTLEIARQNSMKAVSRIVPGITTIGECGCGARIYYSAVSEPIRPPGTRSWISHPGYVFQRGDFFAFGGGAEWMDFGESSFGVDTKHHAYIRREGEISVPESLQYAWDQGKKAQAIIRQQVRVGMTAGESLNAIVAAMEEAGYIFTPFTDVDEDDYKEIQEALADTDKSGFYIDLHAMGNNGGGLVTVGPSMAAFRRDRDPLVIQENHIFAFEYAVHTNLPERPGFPITINFSNPQVVTNLGVEWIQPPNEEIILIH